jgi:hypothetical protein
MVPLTFDPLRGSSVAVAVGSFSSIVAQPEKSAAQQATVKTCFFMILLLDERNGMSNGNTIWNRRFGATFPSRSGD